MKKKTPPCLQLVVPESLQDTVLKSLHSNLIAGHLGVKKTTNKIKQKFYRYRLKDVLNFGFVIVLCVEQESPTEE